ncbi:MAG: class I SAM-dependent methyltransferase [Candidatus Margulisiibacteriota bacterium]
MKDFKYINKEAIALSDNEIAENRKRLEERDSLHREYGLERLAAYWSIIDRLGPAEGSVLEIGTGRGVTASLLAKKYKAVTTVDISDSDIKTSFLNASYEKVLDRISYCICDAADLPFKDGQFECSVSINGFHHFKDPSAVIGEMIRVTNGTVVLADFSESGFEIVRKIHKLDGEEHEEHESNVGLISEIFDRFGYKAKKFESFHHKVFVVNKKALRQSSVQGGENK